MGKKWWTGLTFGVLSILAAVLWMARWSRPNVFGLLEVNGRIEGDQAAIGAEVGGKIERLLVREGDRLEAGGLIAAFASNQLQARMQEAEHVLHTARGQLAGARARVLSLQSQIETAKIAVTLAEGESQAQIGKAQAALGTAQAQLHQAEADLEKTAKDHARYQTLFAKGVIAAQQLDTAKAADAGARAAVEAARKQVTQAEKALELARTSRVNVTLRRKEVQTAIGQFEEAQAAVETARARLETAEAGLEIARATLDDTRVVAPFAGTVLRKLVEVGEVVAAGTPLVTLVDLSKLHAKVYVAAADLGKVKIGDQARVYTDAFPRQYFQATVSQISQQAEFTPRDVHMQDERVKLVFAVKLAIHNPQGILKPGMPIDARIRWEPQASWRDEMD